MKSKGYDNSTMSIMNDTYGTYACKSASRASWKNTEVLVKTQLQWKKADILRQNSHGQSTYSTVYVYGIYASALPGRRRRWPGIMPSHCRGR